MNLLPQGEKLLQPVSSLIFIMIFTACRQHSPGNTANTIDDLSGFTDEIRIDNWQIYKADTGKVRVSGYHAQHDYVDISDSFPSDQKSSYYAECTVVSRKDQDAALLMGASGKLSVWVNTRPYLIEAGSRTERNENILPVRFTKGENKIRLKVDSVTNKKTFYLSISSIAHASHLYILYNASNFLKNSLVVPGDSLVISFNKELVPAGDSSWADITGLNGDTLWQGRLDQKGTHSIPLSMLPGTGAYYCHMQTGKTKFEQAFIYGDHGQVFRRTSDRLLSYSKTDEDRINTQTLLLRYHHLDSAWKNDGPGGLLNRKIALTLADIQSSLLRFSRRQEGFAHLPGLHLRGFRSEIDGGIDNYMLYVPSSYHRGQPIPLIVIMPFITNQFSFIKSWRVADINGIDMVRHVADQYGYALLSPSSRIYDRCNMNAILDKATFEAIAAVKKDYSIDSTRTYIYGSCVGGLLALVVANRHPGIFAAAGAKGPELSYISSRHSSEFYPPSWLKKNNILYSTQNFHTTPLYIIHSRVDKKAPYGCSRMLVDSIHSSGGVAMLETLQDVSKTKDFDLYPTAEVTEKMFHFFKDKHLSPGPVMAPVKFRTAAPMSDLFGEGFLIVEGTCGERNANTANKASVKVISNSWENMYHTTCRIKKDIAVTEKDIQAFNLILIGTPASNSLTQKLITRLPCSISKDSVTVGGKGIKGNDLEYALLYPNPLQPEKYILMEGCNDGVTPITNFDLPYTGWYDYEVHSQKGKLHEKGLLLRH